MAGERNYIQVPPDSTGKKVRLVHTAQLFYKNATPNFAWDIGEHYSTTFSDSQVYDFHVHGHQAISTTTGILEVHYDKYVRYQNLTPNENANILDEDGVTVIGEVDTYEDVYINAINITGFDNPEHAWNIDRFGSGQVAFGEGPPQLTADGAVRVNDAKLLANYDFSKSNLPNEFVNSREGGSEVTNTWDPTTRGVKLTVGTAATERVTQTSNLFHSFENGGSLLFQLAARVGDTGKENVVRVWGAFDANDGYLFALKGSDAAPGPRNIMGVPTAVTPADGSALRVIHRYSFGGSVVDHEILQNEWNKDTLLGTGGGTNPSGMSLDVSKINSYWLDYQFIGGGRTRWGVFYDGERIVCHEIYHGNGEEGAMTQNHHPLSNSSRPLCFAMANYGVSASGSEFYAYGATVLSELTSDPLSEAQQISSDTQTKLWGSPELQPYWRTHQTRNGSASQFPGLLRQNSYSAASSTQYAMTLSPVQFFGSGDENHSVYQPLTFQISNYKISDMTPRIAEARLFYNCLVRGADFQSEAPSSPTVEVDVKADHLAHVIQICRIVIEDGTVSFDFEKFADSFQYGTVRNGSDQTLARALQALDAWTSTSDYYSTGTNRVLLEVGQHPVYGAQGLSDRHYFADRQPVAIRETDGDETVSNAFSTATTFTGFKTSGGSGYASADQVDNPADWHFLSYVTSRLAWLYNSQADIDDDRLTRVLSVSDCVGLQLGQVLTVNDGAAAGATCRVMKVSVSGVPIAANSMVGATDYQIVTVGDSDFTAQGATVNAPGEIFTSSGAGSGTGTVVAISGNTGTVAVVGRSLATGDAATASVSSLDVGLVAGNYTTDGGGAGNITSVATDSTIALDFWTSLKALQYDTDLGMDADEDITTGLALYGNPPPRAAWTFMIKWLESPSEDSDGDTGPTESNSRVNWNIFWRERTQ